MEFVCDKTPQSDFSGLVCLYMRNARRRHGLALLLQGVHELLVARLKKN